MTPAEKAARIGPQATAPAPGIIRKVTMTPPSGQQTESTTLAVPAEVDVHIKAALKKQAHTIASVIGDEIGMEHAKMRKQMSDIDRRLGLLEMLMLKTRNETG